MNSGRFRRVASGALMAMIAAGGLALASDADVAGRIQARLERAKFDRKGEVTVSVVDGRARLTGVTETLLAKRQAEELALKEIAQVENDLRVVAEKRSDTDLLGALEDAVLRYPYYSVFDAVGIEVQQGAVRLTGSVRSIDRKKDIERRIAETPGVTALKNDVSVQAASLFDDDLRRVLYRRIYGDDRFVQYSVGANPPIRILVDRGKVTLVGWVVSRTEQQLLGHIARSTSAFSVTNLVNVESEAVKEPVRKS